MHAGRIAAWPVVTLDELGFDWIEANHEDNRNGRGRFLCGECRWRRSGRDDRNPSADKLIGHRCQQAIVAIGITVFVFYAPSPRKAGFGPALPERSRNIARVVR